MITYSIVCVYLFRTSFRKWREVDALRQLRHDHIVQYIDSWEEEASVEWFNKDKKYDFALLYLVIYTNVYNFRDPGMELERGLFILTELCEKDTLKQWLKKNTGEKSRNRKLMITYFEQV